MAKPERYYPCQKILRLGEGTTTTTNNRRIEANRILSIANRRLYRQSRVYSMKIDVDPESALALAGVEVYVLRNNWDLHGAYKLAMEQYYNANREEMMAGGAKTRWHDFRVQSGVDSDLLLPAAAQEDLNAVGDFVTLSEGDHSYASITDSAGTFHEFTLHRNPSGTQYGILDEWMKKDRADPDPSSASTSLPYAGISEDVDEANYDLLRASGDYPPYALDADEYCWVKVSHLQAGTNQKLSTGFFEAPLGLVILRSTGGFPTAAAVRELPVTVTFQSGKYKGVKAPAYATPVLTPEKKYEVV
jgi:hypothetical protein